MSGAVPTQEIAPPIPALARLERVGLALVLGAMVALPVIAVVARWLGVGNVASANVWVQNLNLVLAFLADASWPDRRFTAPKWSGLLLYGIAIELLQTQIPNRVFSIGDIVANGAGIALYAFGGIYLLQRLGWR